MDLFIIILLLLGGLILLILELVAIPGTGIVGLAGVGMIVYGIVRVYGEYGALAGNIAVVCAIIVGIGLLIYSLRAKTWQRFALNKTIEGKANELKHEDFKVGDEGLTLTRLASGGTADINGQRIEVFATTAYVDPKTPIKIERIEGTKIFVTPLSE
jgi:Membrane-bound serine protease (ClpP class)